MAGDAAVSWTQGMLHWPASAEALHTSASGVLGQLPESQNGAVARLQGLAPRAQYRPTPISQAAAALAGMRAELDRLLVTGRCLTVTPYQHGVGQHQGNQYSLAAPNAVATLATKM